MHGAGHRWELVFERLGGKKSYSSRVWRICRLGSSTGVWGGLVVGKWKKSEKSVFIRVILAP